MARQSHNEAEAQAFFRQLEQRAKAQVMRASRGQFDPHLLEMFLNWAASANVSAHHTPQGLAAFSIGNTA